MTELESYLLPNINKLPSVKRLWVAYSGGVDSHVLLYALYRNRSFMGDKELCVIHIDHQLSPSSAQWSTHCQNVCRDLGLNYRSIVVDAKSQAGESPEAKAREARYQAFRSLIKVGDCLLTAHHQDDQAETLLLQLLRGSGPRGLAAMPTVMDFGHGCIARPFLNISRKQILAYARAQQLHWIDDISNDNPAFDRNFLRLEVIPLLKQRWPALAKTLSRSAELCAETIALFDEFGDADLDRVRNGEPEKISIMALQALSIERQRNVVRAWLKGLGLSCPSQKILNHLWEQVIVASDEAMPVLRWPGGEIRRYRGNVYAMQPMQNFMSDQALHWSTQNILVFPTGGEVHLESATGKGIKATALHQQTSVTVKFRQGGERCKLPNRGGEHSLKNLFQENGIVPWMRERIPLIYIGEKLAAVGDLFVCEEFAANTDEAGMCVKCRYAQAIR